MVPNGSSNDVDHDLNEITGHQLADSRYKFFLKVVNAYK